MAEGNLREYLRGEVVWVKKYFYVLRPVLAMRWIERRLGAVPMEFDQLVAATVDEPELRVAIDRLVADKRAGTELGKGARIAAISDFVERELKRLRGVGGDQPVSEAPIDALDALFRETVGGIRP